MASHPSFTSIFKGAAGLGLGVALALGAIEGGMRLLGYGSVQTLAYGHVNYSKDLPEDGYAGRPLLSGIHSGEGYSAIHFNSHGFHDAEHAFAKLPGVFRLLVVGNSYTMANQVALNDGYVARLGEELRDCAALAGREIETINLGVEGYTIHQQFLMLRDYGLSFSPDFVLLQANPFLVPGDFDPLKNLSPRLKWGPRGELEVDYAYLDAPEFRKKISPAANLLVAVSDHSRLLQYGLQLRRALAQAPAKQTEVARGDAQAALDQDPVAYASYREGRDIAFSEMARLVQTRGVPFAVAITPEADMLSGQPYQPKPLIQDWRALAASLDAPLFDVEDEARAQVRATGVWLHKFSPQRGLGHLNRAGNAFFAHALAPRICKLAGDKREAWQMAPLRR